MKEFKLKGKFQALDKVQLQTVKGGVKPTKPGPIIGGTPPPIGLGLAGQII